MRFHFWSTATPATTTLNTLQTTARCNPCLADPGVAMRPAVMPSCHAQRVRSLATAHLQSSLRALGGPIPLPGAAHLANRGLTTASRLHRRAALWRKGQFGLRSQANTWRHSKNHAKHNVIIYIPGLYGAGTPLPMPSSLLFSMGNNKQLQEDRPTQHPNKLLFRVEKLGRRSRSNPDHSCKRLWVCMTLPFMTS